MTSTKRIQAAYGPARDAFAVLGVDADAAVRRLAEIPISLHCWHGDDVGGIATLILSTIVIGVGTYLKSKAR